MAIIHVIYCPKSFAVSPECRDFLRRHGGACATLDLPEIQTPEQIEDTVKALARMVLPVTEAPPGI